MAGDASPDLDRDDFIVQFLNDLARGELKTLEEYYQRYPGHEDVIASEWRRLRRLADDDSVTGAGRPSDPTIPETEPAPAKTRATALGKYRIERELGGGSQGTVFLAWDTALNRRVALKVLKASWSASSAMVRRFEVEAQALARIDHPGIATVFDAGAIRGLHYIAMRHVEGRTLAEEIADRKKSGSRIGAAEVARLVTVTEQAARALHYAHEAGLVHRDVKPGNLMISPGGAPVLLDFGLALLRGSDHRLTATGDVLGTPAFMAPEQMAGERGRVDRRADVYGLAATLHEALTCRASRPRHERDPAAALRARPPARRLEPSLSRDLEAVLAAALERDPDRRYATAAAFADDLARVRAGSPVLVRPPSTWRALVAWCRRAPAAAALILIAPIALAAGLGALALKNRQIENAAADLAAKGTAADAAAQVARERFAEFRRLDDLRRVQDLEDRERELWPPYPDRVAAMERWLKDAEDLANRLPEHRSALLALRRRGAEAPREAFAQGDPAVTRLLDERRALQAAEAELRTPEPTTRRQGLLRKFVDDAKPRIAAQEGGMASRPVWKFERVEDQWVHDNLALLVARLETLTGPSIHERTITSVKHRVDVARSLESVSLVKPAEDWRAAVEAIGSSGSPYGGLRIAPVLGLVPLGRDPESGLWEFAHVLSGTPPRRGASGALEIDEGSSIVLVLIPGGKTRIGARPPLDELEPPGDHVDPVAIPLEGPPHDVVLDPFLISKYEMTQGQWLRVTGQNPSHHNPRWTLSASYVPTLRHPVEQASIEELEDVLHRIGLVLPTEAQWEHAARARTTTPWWHGPAIESFLHDDNLADTTLDEKVAARLPFDPERRDGWWGSAPVGSYRANPFGLHDVIGNVSEACADEFDYYDAPFLPRDGLRCARSLGAQAVRGGSYGTRAVSARSSYRSGVHQTERSPAIGVRPALPVTPP
jgi:formylglycine-generating enzyme required for sulfatase activity